MNMNYLIEAAHAAAEHLNHVRTKPKYDIRKFHLLFGDRHFQVEFNGDIFDLSDYKLGPVEIHFEFMSVAVA